MNPSEETDEDRESVLREDEQIMYAYRKALIEECVQTIAALEREREGMFGAKYNQALADAISALRKMINEPAL